MYWDDADNSNKHRRNKAVRFRFAPIRTCIFSIRNLFDYVGILAISDRISHVVIRVR